MNSAAGYWRDETRRSLPRSLGDGAAGQDGGGRRQRPADVAELARAVERVAYGLPSTASRPGPHRVSAAELDRVIVLALAATRLGAILNPIPPTYRANELRFILDVLEAQAFVVPQRFRNFDYVEMVEGLRAQAPRLERVWVARGTPGRDMLPFASLLETAWEQRAGRRPLLGTDPNAVSEVIFTSGTTGEPKGVMHTSNTVLSIIYPLIERLRFSERDVTLMSSTFGHQTGFLYGYCMTVLLGGTGVWLDAGTPGKPRA